MPTPRLINVCGSKIVPHPRCKTTGHMPTSWTWLTSRASSITEERAVTLKIKAVGQFQQLNGYSVWINGNPLYGQKGVALPPSNESRFDICLPLTVGFNKIQVGVVDRQGLQSLRQTLYMTYNPKAVTDSPTVYFIGIGISRFADELPKPEIQF